MDWQQLRMDTLWDEGLSADSGRRRAPSCDVRETGTQFFLTLALPEWVRPDQIDAKFESGTLRLCVPKAGSWS